MGNLTGKTWVDNSTPAIMAADLETIEQAILDVQSAADSATIQVPLDTALWGDAASLTLTRSGDTVTLTASGLLGPVGHTGAIDVAEIPHGFRPTLNIYGVTWRGKRYNTSGNTLRISETPSGPLDYLTVTYVTTNAWPT